MSTSPSLKWNGIMDRTFGENSSSRFLSRPRKKQQAPGNGSSYVTMAVVEAISTPFRMTRSEHPLNHSAFKIHRVFGPTPEALEPRDVSWASPPAPRHLPQRVRFPRYNRRFYRHVSFEAILGLGEQPWTVYWSITSQQNPASTPLHTTTEWAVKTAEGMRQDGDPSAHIQPPSQPYNAISLKAHASGRSKRA